MIISKQRLAYTIVIGIVIVAILTIIGINRGKVLRKEPVKKAPYVAIIDGATWDRTTFIDEAEQCWWIYTHPKAGDRNIGHSIFVTPCGGMK